MLSMDCENCEGLCCTSKKRELHVMLIPSEIDRFKGFSRTLKKEHGEIAFLKKDKKGNCIFYDSKSGRCKTYTNRPFDCRTYPLLIYFDKRISFKLDNRICPKTEKCSLKEIEQIKQKWLSQDLTIDWIKAYTEV